ncbi:MAG: hypothetical protein D6806_10575 [Deltaproteobacteria bacterium]|nr:MAG: hypothetical protein D6806_10575 [Deltaproteobacteria bacterium]
MRRKERKMTARTILPLLIMPIALAACSPSAECSPDEWSCSEDARVLTACVDGKIQTIDCGSEGLLCEQGECVLPSRYGSPQWSKCENDPMATTESLHDKMLYYEEIARRLHIHPQLGWISNVVLECDGSDCTHPAVPESQATWRDVERWLSGENDGLWNALYMAAEAYRYAATGDREALDNLRILLEGERRRMDITGVPGLFTRQMIPLGVDGIACPDDLAAYEPDVEKDDNKWVRINQQGCVEVVDPDTKQWQSTDHCGLGEFAGWCWLDNVSQDEYAGHMYALAAIYKFADDEQIRAQVRDMLQQIGDHLVDNQLRFVDWDGRTTEHGRLYAMALDNYPGFNAAMALAFVKVCAAATGDERIENFYQDCLLQRSGRLECLDYPAESPRPYTEHMEEPGLYVGQDSCLSNWNNISMYMAALHDLFLFEHDPSLVEFLQAHLQNTVFAPADKPRPLSEQNNAWFDIIYAAFKRLGPGSDGPAYEAVENAVCMLRQFPASKHTPTVDAPMEKVKSTCTDRLGHEIGDYPRQVAERCPGTFLWWGNPYSLGSCTEDLRVVHQPADYLLAYWMARYFGFIDENM